MDQRYPVESVKHSAKRVCIWHIKQGGTADVILSLMKIPHGIFVRDFLFVRERFQEKIQKEFGKGMEKHGRYICVI